MRNLLFSGSAIVLLLGACTATTEPDATEATSLVVQTPAVPDPSVDTSLVVETSTVPEPPSSTSAVVEQPEFPRFESGECVGDGVQALERSDSYDIECGYVIVLEDRDDEDGSTVSLPVAVARTPNPSPEPDPVIYLAGGGGHAHLDYADYFIDAVGDAILVDRDFIQYNQRGARDTLPELLCPGYTNFLFDLAADPEPGSLWTDEHKAYLADCEAALTGSGVDLTQYNSATNAADARDIRLALGYDEANYYGTSYGTRLGLDLIRDYPEGVRSIILDSVYPPEVDYYTEYASTMHRAFTAVFEGCASDSSCSARYPNLESDFYATVDRLDTEPHMADSQFGPVSVDGGVFMDAMAIYLYSPEWIPRSPQAMDRVAKGDLRPVEDVVVGAVTAPDINWSMFYAMQCREEIPFEDFEEAVALGESLPTQIAEHYTDGFVRFHFEMCERSTSGTARTIESEAVESTVPALVFAGEYDPATPPHWSEATAGSLGNASYVEFPTMGHGIMRSNRCGLRIGLAFIDDPTSDPDVSCVDDLPPVRFALD
jgi:pimeloyl-ACP methyl ester carboxylesterase